MVYYEVKQTYDNRCINGYMLIGGELYTRKELKRLAIPEEYTKEIQIKKTDTYFFFGARLYNK